MSRQATKLDLENVLSELGVAFGDEPTVAELREWIQSEFQKLHHALLALGYGEVGIGTGANHKRLQSLYDAATRAQQDNR